MHLRAWDINTRKQKREQNGRSKLSPSIMPGRSRTWGHHTKKILVDHTDFVLWILPKQQKTLLTSIRHLQNEFIENVLEPGDICCSNWNTKHNNRGVPERASLFSCSTSCEHAKSAAHLPPAAEAVITRFPAFLPLHIMISQVICFHVHITESFKWIICISNEQSC